MTDTPPVRVMSTLAVMGAVRSLLRREGEAAPATAIRFDPTARLVAAIEAGERAEVAILTAEGVAAQVGAGVLDGAGRVDLCRSSIGVAVRAGAPHPDISTPEAFRAALLAAPSLAYSGAGASGLFFAGLIERLGIAPEVRAKATVIPQGFTAELAASGEAALAIQQVSELLAVPGIEVVGPLPEPLNARAVFSAAPFAGSDARARAFLGWLAAGLTSAVLREAGLEPA